MGLFTGPSHPSEVWIHFFHFISSSEVYHSAALVSHLFRRLHWLLVRMPNFVLSPKLDACIKIEHLEENSIYSKSQQVIQGLIAEWRPLLAHGSASHSTSLLPEIFSVFDIDKPYLLPSQQTSWLSSSTYVCGPIIQELICKLANLCHGPQHSHEGTQYVQYRDFFTASCTPHHWYLWFPVILGQPASFSEDLLQYYPVGCPLWSSSCGCECFHQHHTTTQGKAHLQHCLCQ